jgi:two-component system sensor histidine kinase YesM
VVVIAIASFRYNIQDTETLSRNYTARLLREVNRSIDSYILNTKSISFVVVENSDVCDLMSYYDSLRGNKPDEPAPDEIADVKARASLHLNTLAKTRNDITNIAIISKYGDVVLNDSGKEVNPHSDYNLMDWYLKPMSYKDDIVVSPSHVQRLVKGEYRWVISISKAILDPKTGYVTGIMLIDLNYRSIERICEDVQLGRTGYVYLVDGKESLIYHPQQQLIFSGIKHELPKREFISSERGGYARLEAEGKIYLRNDSEVTGWSAIGVVNTKELAGNIESPIKFYVVLTVIAIAFSAVAAVMISTNITMPIKKLESTMRRVEQGDLEVQVEISGNDEIGHMGNAFNSMIVKVGGLMERMVAEEEEKRLSEIKALQAQINPHFLYNTLETIIWMSAAGKNDDVVNVASALAQLFRTSISRGKSLAPLSVEIKSIESYLTIQKMRYKDKLDYGICIPKPLLGMMVPKLILQPIVENAIYHGVKPRDEGGSITIGARQEEGLLIISVSDDGVGMTPEQAANLFMPKQNDSGGIGFLNVHNRIKLIFGEEYGLKCVGSDDSGTHVDIRLPLVEESEVAAWRPLGAQPHFAPKPQDMPKPPDMPKAPDAPAPSGMLGGEAGRAAGRLGLGGDVRAAGRTDVDEAGRAGGDGRAAGRLGLGGDVRAASRLNGGVASDGARRAGAKGGGPA